MISESLNAFGGGGNLTGLLGNLATILDDPYARARQAKQEGRKVVGVTPMHFPEELVHAAGALPIVLQESNEPVTAGFGHMYPFYCGFTRSNVDLAVRGKLDILDAVVVSDMCLQTRYMGYVMQRQMPKTPFAYIQWPLEVQSDRWLGITVDRLERVRGELEGILGTEIKEAALRESIALYSEHRALLRRLYDLRRAQPGLLRAREMMALVLSGMVMPKEEHVKLLGEAIVELERRPAPEAGGVKLFLSGHLCQAAKADILDLIENLGGVVVGDDLFTGYRYFATATPDGAGAPMEALAKRYLNQSVPCPTRADYTQDWAEYIAARSGEHGAQGVVVMIVKFCEPHMIYYPHLKAVLAEAGVPHVQIETEHEVVSLEGIRTRLQAFIEMLKRK